MCVYWPNINGALKKLVEECSIFIIKLAKTTAVATPCVFMPMGENWY